jgi:ERCC4-type nuclease
MMSSSLTFDLNGIRVQREKKPQAAGGSDDPFRRLVVCPFRVVCDSREQLPYGFSGMKWTAGETLIVPTVVKGLASGDYSIENMDGSIAIERKELSDLYGSVTWGRDRFEREIERLNSYKSAFVVIEATWPEIMAPSEHRPGWENRTEPRSVEGTIVAWSLRYPGVHWWACGDRRGAECRTFSILRTFWKEQQK